MDSTFRTHANKDPSRLVLFQTKKLRQMGRRARAVDAAINSKKDDNDDGGELVYP